MLRPGGHAVVSTLNLDGGLYDCNPGNAPTMPWLPGSLVAVPGGVPLPPDEDRAGRAMRNWRRLRRRTVRGDGWAVAPMPAHEFGILTHFTTVDQARAEFLSYQLEPVSLFAADSRTPLLDGAQSDAPYVHVIARRG